MSAGEGTAGSRGRKATSKRAPVAAKRAAPKATRAPSPLREAQKELARQTLLESAIAAFEADGYVDVTVDDIVQRAGTSRGTFYLYFQSKSEILRAIIEQLRLEVADAGLFEALAEMGEPTVDGLQVWFEHYVDFYLAHRRLWAAVHQALVMEPEFGEIIHAGIDSYIDLFKAQKFVKNAKPDDLRLAATMMFTLVDRFMYLWLSFGQEIDRAKATRALAEAFHATLRR